MRILLVATSLIACASCVFDYESVGSGRLGTGGLGGDGGSAGMGGASGASGSGGQGGMGGAGGSVTGSSCTVATQAEDCNGKSCNPVTFECSEFGSGERGTCQTCVSDDNCWGSDHRCVPMYFDDNKRFPNEYTGFCLPKAVQDFVDGPYRCNGEEPYVAVLSDRVSMSGEEASAYCGVQEDLTTCYAVHVQLEKRLCTAGSDDDCPAGGICRYTQDNGKWDDRCTYFCTSDSECRNEQGWTLNCEGYCGT